LLTAFKGPSGLVKREDFELVFNTDLTNTGSKAKGEAASQVA
jgi:hypothetical protein